MKYASDLQEESRRLGEMVCRVEDALEFYRERKKTADEELKEAYTMYTSGNTEFYDQLPVLSNLQELYARQLTIMEKAVKRPYFGKIIFSDLREGDQEQELYIGQNGLTDYKNNVDIWVVDWRAPVAEVYYSGSIGETQYDGPRGLIPIDLKLKTTLDVQDGKLLGLFDSEVVVNDDLLVEYLSRNKDVVLNEIVATIQEDQDKIIRKSLSANVIVQGVAGSGKTTVAVHRIAFLLYRYRDVMTFNSVYVLASSNLFLNYMTSALPDLDVPAVRQGTVRDVLEECARKLGKKSKMKIVSEQPEYLCGDVSKKLAAFLRSFEDGLFGEEIKIGPVVVWEPRDTRAILQNTGEMPLKEKALLLDKRLRAYLKSRKEQIEDELRKEGGLDEPAGVILERATKALGTCFRKRCKPLKAAELLGRFRQSLDMAPKLEKEYAVEDLALYIFFTNYLDGVAAMEDIRQVVIDEAQDLSELLFCCLKSLFHNATFTIVGDVMQNIHEDTIQSWEPVIDGVFGGQAAYIPLLKSYRNTIEISNFAKQIIEQHTGAPFEAYPLVRHGEPVHVTPYDSDEMRTEKGKQILAELAGKGFQINAVLCRDDETAARVHEALGDSTMLLDINAEGISRGTYVMSAAQAKGLEFDAVIIWDCDSYDLYGENLDFKRLYVAATRALHELYLFSNKSIYQELADKA